MSPALVTYHFASSEHLRQQTLTFAADRVGATLGDRYVEATSGDREAAGSIVVRIRPELWLSVDYKKQFSV